MSKISEEIASYLGSASMTDEEFLEHYGMPRRSGRYPYGSGKDPYQHSRDFLGRIEDLKKTGWTETAENIQKEFGIKTNEYYWEKSICNDQRRMERVATAKRLRDKEKLSNVQIGKRMGVNESNIREWFKEDTEIKIMKTKETADFLRQYVKEHKMVDVGANVEYDLNVTRDKLDTALYMLKKEGYNTYTNRIPQPTNPGKMTTQRVLCDKSIVAKEGQKVPKEIYDYEKIKTIKDYSSPDGGRTFVKKFNYPSSLDSKRLMVRYDEEGGTLKDGIVELRRGVKDLSLGASRYSQVRILVDGTHYIKGMAVYSDDMPDGVDIIFNTNKKKAEYPNKIDVLKKIKADPDNPFGSNIKDADQGGQYWYDSKTGKEVLPTHPNAKLGLINKRADQGDWTEWADALPSQFLSKQSKQLAKKQLDLAKANKEDEFNDIMQLTNPTIKKFYLNKFAESCDSAAVDLKAAALPGQKYHVIIPINSLTEKQVYAPQYPEGSKLALIRYPHGGIFEIPILTVTHKNASANKIIGKDSIDAIGINKKVADRLSGADFDGDTVMCIPTNDRSGKVKILSRDELKDLKDFNNKEEYGYTHHTTDSKGKIHYYRGDKEYKVMSKSNVNNQMGRISNLITDMTLSEGATEAELARAVKHSMVIIDAEKHKLDYKRSYIENGIRALELKYQPKKFDADGNAIDGGGARTIISKSKGVEYVPKRKGEPVINIKGSKHYDPSRPEGALIYKNADDRYLYYPDFSYTKNNLKKLKTTSGESIIYDPKNKKEAEKYEPLKVLNPKTKKYEYVFERDSKTNEVYLTNKDKTLKYRVNRRDIQSTKMAETDDARTLISRSRHPMEILYADYANSMKALANKARKTYMSTTVDKKDPKAAKIYKKEVESLDQKIKEAGMNKTKERHATRLAVVDIQSKVDSDPNLLKDRKEYKKLSQRAMTKARDELGSISRRNRSIEITDKEWEAIQAGAISSTKLKIILDNSDPDLLRERAMPKNKKTLNATQINRIHRLRDSNFSIYYIAEQMGISPSAVYKYLKGEK